VLDSIGKKQCRNNPKLNVSVGKMKVCINHLFFECVVAKVTWSYVSDFLSYEMGIAYISVASKWLHKDKFYGANIISTAIMLRGIWLIRNDFVFNK
jgi:hypothetical protein